MNTLYDILGLNTNSSLKDVKEAYKKLALQYHPDKGGDATMMGLINDAYKTLSDQVERERYDTTLSVSVDSDLMPDAEDLFYLQAGDTVSFSEAYRNEHKGLVQQYTLTPLASYPAFADFQAFESNIYTIKKTSDTPPLLFHDVFTAIRERTKLGISTFELPILKHPLIPAFAVTLFTEFLSGKYGLAQLKPLKEYFAVEIANIKKRNEQLPELLLYQGMLDIMLITDLGPNAPYDPISSIKKITDYAKIAQDAVFPFILPLFYNRYFRNLYAYSMHLYWQPNGSLLHAKNLKLFDGRLASKRLLEVLLDRLSHDNANDDLLTLVRFVKLLYKFENDINQLSEDEQDASHYREKAFHLLDWMPALFGKANKIILINTFLQIGIKFQQASQKEKQSVIKMADEQLALRMYMTCYMIAHQDSNPDEELYANSEVLKYIAAFQFKDPRLAEIIPALQKRVLSIADIFPFFNGWQPNITHLRQKQQSIYLLRRLLNALVGILEHNKTHTDSIVNIDHAPANILYQAYEACLKNWYQDRYDNTVEKKFRRELMGELLQEKTWVFGDVEQNLNSPWVMVDRDEAGWMRPTRKLPYREDNKLVTYCRINGAELKADSGEIAFFMQEWHSNQPGYEKKFSLFDLNEMLEKNIGNAIFSLDPVDPDRPYHPFNAMRFRPTQLCETELLNTMLLTDYLLKFFTTHQEVQGSHPFSQRPIDSMLQQLPGYLRKIIDDYQSAKQHSSALHRFWIEAEEINLTISDPDQTKNGTTRFALGDVKMIVKKHRMERDMHGELNDTANEDEGWPIYVLTAKEMKDLEQSKRKIDGHAMIFIYAEFKLIYWENNKIIHTHTPQDYQETLIRLFKQKREANGKIIQNSENARLWYRSIKEMALQSGMSHRLSPELTFAHEFTIHYDEFAQYFPEFGRLKELSKISTLIRYLDGIRHVNSEQIKALDFIVNPSLNTPPETEYYKNLLKIQQTTSKNITESFQKWREDGFSLNGIRTRCCGELTEIKNQLGDLDVDSYSTEVEEACKNFHTEVSKKNPHISSQRIWNEVVNPQRAEIAKKLRQLKRDDYYDQLMALFAPKVSVSNVKLGQLVNSFLEGNSTPLLDELVAHTKAIVYSTIQEQLPKSTISDVEQALNGSDLAIQKIVQQKFLDMKNNRDRIEQGFSAIGLGAQDEPVNLEGKCLWVPASVRHEVHQNETPGLSRHSFFVYGGVNLQSQINVVKGNGSPLGGNRVGSGSLANSNTVLYQKVGANGEHLKFGITKNPGTRYTSGELDGGRLKIIAQGSRKDMLELERNLHSTLPIGPQERQSNYINIQKAKGYKVPPYY